MSGVRQSWGKVGFPPAPSAVACALLVTLWSLILGCSGSGVPVDGIVRFADGTPVRSGRIEFRHVETRHRGMGVIDDQGRYSLADLQGNHRFEPGEYGVIVVQLIIARDRSLEEHDHGRMVPRQYADYDTSRLRAHVAPEKEGPIVIELEE